MPASGDRRRVAIATLEANNALLAAGIPYDPRRSSDEGMT
jgi:hypothetical protein